MLFLERDRPRLVATLVALACSFSLACSDSGGDEPEGPSVEASATVSELIKTVVTVTWSTAEPTRGYVEYGPTRDLGLSTPLSEEVTEHSELLLGLTPATDYYYRVVAGEGSDAPKSKINEVRTGNLPPITVDAEVTGSGHDELVFATVLGTSNGVYVLNPEGIVVWYWADDRGLQSLRARLSRDKKSVLYNAAKASGDPSEDSALVRVSLDGSEVSEYPVPYLAHDFVELPDGTLAAIVVETLDIDGAEVKSNNIVEVASDRTVTVVWRALDCFDPAVNMSSEPDYGWTLANSLDYDEADDVYYFGSRGLSSIARINRETYECDWVFGAEGNIGFADGSAQFLHQHQFHVVDDRVIVYDNDGAMNETSRVLEYELDFEAETATEVWSFTSASPVYTPVLGEVLKLSGGDTLIDWSYAGRIERVSADGETTWMLTTELGYPFGYITVESSFY